MAPPVVSPEEKKQRRLLTTLVALNGVAIAMLLAAITIGGLLMMTKLNPKAVKIEESSGMPGPSIKIEDHIYNLGESNRYMKAAMQLELNTAGMKEKEEIEFMDEVKRLDPHIRDLIISEISGKTFREVSTPEGKEQLKEELRVKVNALLSRGEVKEVMFTSFAVQ